MAEEKEELAAEPKQKSPMLMMILDFLTQLT